jgi:hypothetical protein
MGVEICPTECATGSERGDSLAALRTVPGMHAVRMPDRVLARINRIAVATKNLLLPRLRERALKDGFATLLAEAAGPTPAEQLPNAHGNDVIRSAACSLRTRTEAPGRARPSRLPVAESNTLRKVPSAPATPRPDASTHPAGPRTR